MEHFNAIRTTALILTLTAMLAACRDDGFIDGMEQEGGEYIEVPVTLLVSSPLDGMAPSGKTRSVADPVPVSSTPVKNVWVIQYRGTDDRAAVIGKPQYIPDFDDATSTVRLLQTPDPCIVVILANTFKETLTFDSGSTIGQLKDKMKENISCEADVLGYNPETASADARFPNDNDYYPIMCGIQTCPGGIDASTEVVAGLMRNIAKVVFNVTNSTAGKTRELTIAGVRLCDIPDRSLYVTDYSVLGGTQPALYPATSDNRTFDSEQHDWNDASGDATTRSFTFYMPVNRRGTTTNTDETQKPKGAPSGATYAVISAYYTDNGRQVPVTFRLYVGANLVNDFNIEANHVYSYDITINGISDAGTDLRVDIWDDVDFTASVIPRANCYILNPPASPHSTRRFKIPVDRVNTFWGDQNEGNHPYELNPQFYMLTNTPWNAEIVWADFKLHTTPGSADYNFSITKATGAGPSDYIEVEVADGVSGNVLVGLKTSPGGTPNAGYSWSWHLWITDYDPSAARQMSKADGVFVYPVTNGNVHRYKGTLWDGTGAYSGNTFMMDRNVGQLSEYSTGTGQGALYYQFGNKNPFPGTAWYDGDGKTMALNYIKQTYTQAHADVMKDGTGDKQELEKYNNVPKTVWNPTSFILIWTEGAYCSWPYYWTFEDKYNPREYNGSILWYDPTTATEGTRAGMKSIFDPCPPGWELPSGSVYSDFTANTTQNSKKEYIGTTNYAGGTTPHRGFRSENIAGGIIYWPYVQSSSGDYDAAGEIFFPNSSYRDAYYRLGGIYDSCTRLLTSQIRKINPNTAGALSGYVYGPAKTFFIDNYASVAAPVRCVTSTISE